MPLIKSLSIALLLCFSSLSLAAMPKPFEANYVGYRKGQKIGTAKQKLEHVSGNQFKLYYESLASLFFLTDKRYETSLFVINDNEMIPQKYTYIRKGTGRDKSLKLQFDAEKKVITQEKGDPVQWSGELDNLLYRFHFQQSLMTEQQEFDYRIINSRAQLKDYKFKILGEEKLSLPYGELDTLKVQIVRASSSKRTTFIWFAPSLDYLMVRIEQYKSGKQQADVQLSAYEG
jgi:hypothetical protein